MTKRQILANDVDDPSTKGVHSSQKQKDLYSFKLFRVLLKTPGFQQQQNLDESPALYATYN